MKITNKYNIPEIFINLIDNKEKEFNPKRFSVTELLSPTREIVLKRKYWNVLSEDVSDRMSALLGTAFHKLMEEQCEENVEVKMELQLKDDYVLVGKVDKIDGDTIIDYKTCKVSKIMKESFDDDRLQGLMYAYMRLMITGVKTKRLIFYNFMKDWSKISYKSGYPVSPIYEWKYNIQDSDYDFIETFIKNKLLNIKEALECLPECTDEEKWYTGTKYAVYKNLSDKKAIKIFDSENEAHEYITNHCNGVGEIQIRKGENLKCNYYCVCKEVCDGKC